MGRCYTDDNTAGDHIHTGMYTEVQKSRLGKVSIRLKMKVVHSDIDSNFSCFSNFALFLEDYLMYVADPANIILNY